MKTKYLTENLRTTQVESTAKGVNMSIMFLTCIMVRICFACHVTSIRAMPRINPIQVVCHSKAAINR